MKAILHLEISADTLAAFREAREVCTRAVGHRMDDDDLVRMIVERALCFGEAGGRYEGRSPYQVKIAVCSECGRGARAAAGQLHPVTPARVEQALCDAQRLGDTAAPIDSSEGAPARATQTIPPRIRRDVLRRDGGCIVPGCRNSVFREIHHVIPRAGGGGHVPANLAELCSAHHAQIHAGRIRIAGTPSEGFRIEHADGRPYGTAPLAPLATSPGTTETTGAPPPTWDAADNSAPGPSTSATVAASGRTDRDLRVEALAGLRQLGFRDREARRALAGAEGDTLESLLRDALVTLGRHLAVQTQPGGRACEPTMVWAGRSSPRWSRNHLVA